MEGKNKKIKTILKIKKKAKKSSQKQLLSF
jgi:hypothetical protein